jgi:maltokinase
MSTTIDVRDTSRASACACTEARRTRDLHRDDVLRPLMADLVPWLIGRRWFSHERGCFQELRPLDVTVLSARERGGSAPVLVHAVAEARHDDGAKHRYQILVGLRPELPPAFPEAPFGRADGGVWDGWWLYEGSGDPELMELLLERATSGDAGAALRFTATPGSRIAPGLVPRRLEVDQSNTAIAFGDQLLLKLFRQPLPGRHPETEVLAALTGAGCAETPKLTGWLSDGGHHEHGTTNPMNATNTTTVLGIVEEFLEAQGDGWQLALAQARECLPAQTSDDPGLSGFAGEAWTLGAACASVHASLAEAFPTARLTADQIRSQVADMRARLAAAIESVPRLAHLESSIELVYDEYARAAATGSGLWGQRTHGDLHLGQVLRIGDGWRVIDFEGEPSRPVEERGEPQSPLRDVAGMLRSFDYVAELALREAAESGPEPLAESGTQAEFPYYTRRAHAWTARNCAAFVDGYAAKGRLDPRAHPIAMRAFELDKAVYEVHYEAEHRPDWLPVPMAAVGRILFRRRGSFEDRRPAA